MKTDMEFMEEFMEEFYKKYFSYKEGFRRVQHVGSRVTCNPVPENADFDILLLAKNSRKYCEFLESKGFKLTNEGYEGPFLNVKKDKFDLIITQDETFYKKFLLATEVCEKLNLLNKLDRVSLFQSILYNWKVGV